LQARVEHNLAVHGYPHAHATVRTRPTNDPEQVVVAVGVDPGVPRRLEERAFYIYGATREQVEDATSSYPVQRGDRADWAALDAADNALEQALRSRGWARAAVSHDLVWASDLRRSPRVVLRVRVDAGPRIATRFEGNEHFDESALQAALGLGKESDRTPSHLADKLRAFYLKRGFLDAEVWPELRGGEQDPVQVLVLHVNEHRRVRVVERRYPCLKLEAIRHLSSGGPRSPSEIGNEIDSFLEDELPGTDLFVDPNPKAVSVALGAGAGQIPTGARPVPLDLRPDATFVADTYDRAVEHVQELYRNEGFLHAEVGPVQVVRAQCDRRSPAGRCDPAPLPPIEPVCTYDASGVPLPTEPLDPALVCRPDPARGVECAPEVQVVIPIKLGPRTLLWDVAFTGVRSVSEKMVAEAAQVPLGEYASTAKLDEARRRIVDWYKELGYAYADVKYVLEPSLDNTRARVRFDVSEGDQVYVSAIVVRGLRHTRESIVRRRIALVPGEPYRTSDVRKTEQGLGTLGVFLSYSVTLADPYVPAPTKVVIIDVVEKTPGYVEARPGFSTGEGIRGTLELGYLNLFGDAWSVVLHLQASYLPDFLILDPQVAQNYKTLPWQEHIATRDTITFAWREMGLGPTIRSQLDGVYVRDLERDFTLEKGAGLGTLTWRPVRQFQVSGGPVVERNSVHLFQAGTIEQYLQQNPGKLDLQRLLRVPDGRTNVFGGRVVVTWDRRDSAFNAHKGTYVVVGFEQVNSYPEQENGIDPTQQFESHILRMTQTLAAYVPITSKVSLAAELRLGEVANLLPCSAPFAAGTQLSPYLIGGAGAPPYCTYPDRLFFMGGFESMRGWLQESLIPQEYVDQIAHGTIQCTSQSNCQVPIRGGNLMVNPRVELRFPVLAPFDGALFADFGNVWNDPSYITQHALTVRADGGAGVRVQTPVGPLVFDYGINVTRFAYEDFGAGSFAIGLF
jgi:outer membrane protein assembly factor BamA